MRTCWTAVLVMALLAGCASMAGSLRAPLREGPFAFVLGVSTGWQGYEILRVSASGETSYLFSPSGQAWRVMRFRLTPDELTELREAVARAHVLDMQDTYRGTPSQEGTRVFVKVREGDARKIVFCDNQQPTSIASLIELVQQRVIEPRRPQMAEAERVDYLDAREEASDALP